MAGYERAPIEAADTDDERVSILSTVFVPEWKFKLINETEKSSPCRSDHKTRRLHFRVGDVISGAIPAPENRGHNARIQPAVHEDIRPDRRRAEPAWGSLYELVTPRGITSRRSNCG